MLKFEKKKKKKKKKFKNEYMCIISDDGTMKCENDFFLKKCLDGKTKIFTTCRDKSLQKLCTSKASFFFFVFCKQITFVFFCRKRKNKYCGSRKTSQSNETRKTYPLALKSQKIKQKHNSLLQSVTIFSKS